MPTCDHNEGAALLPVAWAASPPHKPFSRSRVDDVSLALLPLDVPGWRGQADQVGYPCHIPLCPFIIELQPVPDVVGLDGNGLPLRDPVPSHLPGLVCPPAPFLVSSILAFGSVSPARPLTHGSGIECGWGLYHRDWAALSLLLAHEAGALSRWASPSGPHGRLARASCVPMDAYLLAPPRP